MLGTYCLLVFFVIRLRGCFGRSLPHISTTFKLKQRPTDISEDSIQHTHTEAPTGTKHTRKSEYPGVAAADALLPPLPPQSQSEAPVLHVGDSPVLPLPADYLTGIRLWRYLLLCRYLSIVGPLLLSLNCCNSLRSQLEPAVFAFTVAVVRN
jgi:hypothetical protein